MKLNKKALGMALGIVWGLIIFIATLWVSAKGGGATLGKLEGFYWGYGIGFWGGIIGMIWGFINGFVSGWLIAYFYNRFAKED